MTISYPMNLHVYIIGHCLDHSAFVFTLTSNKKSLSQSDGKLDLLDD